MSRLAVRLTTVLFSLCCWGILSFESQAGQENIALGVSSPTPNIFDAQIVAVGDTLYPRSQLIWDFTNIAFSNALWLGNTIQPWAIIDDLAGPQGWPHGSELDAFGNPVPMPRHDAISKWTHNVVTIGIYDSHDPLVGRDALNSFYKLVQQQVEELAPSIAESTHLTLKLLPIIDERQKGAVYADVRLFPVASTGLKNRFKVLWRHPDALTDQARDEAVFFGGVPFTAAARSQVDGVLQPDLDNSLKFSMCKISSTLGDPMERALLTECVVRALGLPELSQIAGYQCSPSPVGDAQGVRTRIVDHHCYVRSPKALGPEQKSVLSDWNREQDSQSKTMLHDGRDALILRGVGQAGNAEEIHSYYTRPLPGAPGAPRAMSAYDRAILTLLYCPAIKSGMDKYQAIQALHGHPECFPYE